MGHKSLVIGNVVLIRWIGYAEFTDLESVVNVIKDTYDSVGKIIYISLVTNESKPPRADVYKKMTEHAALFANYCVSAHAVINRRILSSKTSTMFMNFLVRLASDMNSGPSEYAIWYINNSLRETLTVSESYLKADKEDVIKTAISAGILDPVEDRTN